MKKQISKKALVVVCGLTLLMAISCTKQAVAPLSWRMKGVTQQGQSLPECSSGMSLITDAVKCDRDVGRRKLDQQLIARIFREVAAVDTFVGNYFREGKFARVHAIKRFISRAYNIECLKVFTYGNLTAVSPLYGCSAAWRYDVACVLESDSGPMVIDPTLCTGPVSVDTWIDMHLHATDIQPYPSEEFWEIVSGSAFTPLDAAHTGYLTDSSYVCTNAFLRYYQDSTGCN